jgi:ribonuclease R
MVSEAVLRAQTAAYYDTDNLGHFGLALRRYAHFTSPIRRYADLLVHRALIDAMGAGAGGLGDTDADTVQRLAEQTSTFERRAMLAERDALDRFTAIYLQDRVGADFSARISGITRFGMFVALSETGASGIIPMRSLNSDFFDFDEAAMQLVGRRTGKVWRLGERLTVRLKEASPVTGGLAFEIVDPGRGDGTGKGSLKGPGRGSLKPHRPPPGQKRSKSRRRKG